MNLTNPACFRLAVARKASICFGYDRGGGVVTLKYFKVFFSLIHFFYYILRLNNIFFCNLSELRGLDGIHTITDRNDQFKIVELDFASSSAVYSHFSWHPYTGQCRSN